MSDDLLRLIPTDPTWQPDDRAVQRAVAALRSLVPGADRVEAELHDEVLFIDQGANFDRVVCPSCRAELSLDWWSEQMNLAEDAHFTRLSVTTPCCHNGTTLNDLVYDWPAGFARAKLSVLNPQRGWLTDAELSAVAVELGHPLRQVMAHY